MTSTHTILDLSEKISEVNSELVGRLERLIRDYDSLVEKSVIVVNLLYGTCYKAFEEGSSEPEDYKCGNLYPFNEGFCANEGVQPDREFELQRISPDKKILSRQVNLLEKEIGVCESQYAEILKEKLTQARRVYELGKNFLKSY